MPDIEDPAPPLSTEATGATEPSDELEHWLLNLRTDAAASPPDWINADPDDERPAGEPPGDAAGQPDTSPTVRATVGRHRTSD